MNNHNYITFTVKVVPQSGRQKLEWDEKREGLKCYLKSAPEKNKANDELCTFLRKTLGTPPGSVAIIRGATSRHKVVKVASSSSFEELLARAGITRQQTIY